MAKGWETISSSALGKKTREEVVKQSHTYNKMMSKTKKKNYEALKKEGSDLYREKEARKEHILDGFDKHILKSRSLINEAISLKVSEEAKKHLKKQKDVRNSGGSNN